MSGAKNNRMNTDFGIAFFIAGSCHTPDGAYAQLLDLKEDRAMALSQVRAGKYRVASKIALYNHMIANGAEWEKLEAQAELIKLEDDKPFADKNIKAAEEELEFIDKCIEKIQPYRMFAHLPDNEAHQAMQREEWKREFIYRAENYYLTTGVIPPAEFESMRKHPDFHSEILPVMEDIKETLKTSISMQDAYKKLEEKRNTIPKLLGFANDTTKFPLLEQKK